MQTIAVEELLSYFKTPSVIDDMSLDVEGAEDMIISSFPFHSHKVLSIRVERPSPFCRDMLRDQGFHFLRARPLTEQYDEFWVHESTPDFRRIIHEMAEAEHACKY